MIHMPFLPMKPVTGLSVASTEWKTLVADEHDWIAQPWLDGGRACLYRGAGNLQVLNEFGSPVQVLLDARAWYRVAKDTLLDGWILRGHFFPWEVLADGGGNHLHATAADRIARAQDLCLEIKKGWPFQMEAILKSEWAFMCTGVLLKQKDGPYVVRKHYRGRCDDWPLHEFLRGE